VLGEGKYGVIASPEGRGGASLELLTDSRKREEMREVGLQRSRDFDWDHIASQYEKVYGEIRARREGVPVEKLGVAPAVSE